MPNATRTLFAAAALTWFSTAGCGVDSSDDATTQTQGAVSAVAATSATQSFLVLFSGGAIPANADTLVAGAGGTIAARYANVGAVLARAGGATFASSVLLDEISRDIDPKTYVTVIGHTDSTGSDELNERLAQDRASAVRDFMVQLGIPAAKIKTISYGKERPQCTEANESCWQKNRRAHFVVTGK